MKDSRFSCGRRDSVVQEASQIVTVARRCAARSAGGSDFQAATFRLRGDLGGDLGAETSATVSAGGADSLWVEPICRTLHVKASAAVFSSLEIHSIWKSSGLAA